MKNEEKIKYNAFPLTKANFILMGICGLMIIVGFLLMLGKPSDVVFNPDIFSTRRIIVGPTIAFLGFVLMIFAIIYKKREVKSDSSQETTEDKK